MIVSTGKTHNQMLPEIRVEVSCLTGHSSGNANVKENQTIRVNCRRIRFNNVSALTLVPQSLPCFNTFMSVHNTTIGGEQRLTTKTPSSIVDFINRNRRFFKEEKEEKYNEVVNSLDDCMEGIEEPLYGFRSNITLVDRQPCILGATCKSPGLYLKLT